MKKRFLTLLLATIMVLSTTMIAYANTDSTTSTFSVDETQVNGTPYIVVPTGMPLMYDDTTASYMCKANVIVYGLIDSSKEVDVFVDKKVTYTNKAEQGSNTIEGYVLWGTNFNSTQNINVWTSEECQQGMNGTEYDSTTAVNKSIAISVLPKDILNLGDYTATIEFVYDANILGMYRDLISPNGIYYTSADVFPSFDDSYKGTTSKLPFDNLSLSNSDKIATFNKGTTILENVNLINSIPDGLTQNIFTGVMRESSTKNDSYVSGLKTIELSKDLYYFSHIEISSTDDKPMIRSCFCQNYYHYGNGSSVAKGYVKKSAASSAPYDAQSTPNLQTVIIPEGFTAENFRKYGTDEPTTTLRNSFEVIGNATVFIKGIDYETNKFIYVPNIVYRGTTGEWMALSGHDDWTFGNKANIVTVYCTNGEIVYQ